MSPQTLARVAVPAWLVPVAPFALFLLLTAAEGQFPSAYPLLYAVKIVLVGGLMLGLGRGYFADVRPQSRGVLAALLSGVALVFLWVLVDRHAPHLALLGGRVGYDPFRQIADPAGRAAFLAVRFLGLVVIVPIIEETFYRGFLLRWITDPDDFRRVPVGTYSRQALAANVVLFALSHPEWLSAALFGLAMCLLLARTRNLFACIVAHAVTNLLLGLYVIHAGAWQYW